MEISAMEHGEFLFSIIMTNASSMVSVTAQREINFLVPFRPKG